MAKHTDSSSLMNRAIVQRYSATSNSASSSISSPSPSDSVSLMLPGDDGGKSGRKRTRHVATNARKKSGRRGRKNSPLETAPELDDDEDDLEEVIVPSTPPAIAFEDFGGLKNVVDELKKSLGLPLVHPEIFDHLSTPMSVQPLYSDASESQSRTTRSNPVSAIPHGVLLVGPSGSGKTAIAYAAANWLISLDSSLSFFKLSGTELVSGYSGESEKKIRSLFDRAISSSPSLVFVDEIDALLPRRDNVSREMEKRIVSQFLSSMDDLARSDGYVVVLAATNRSHAIDPAIRVNGRFDKEISIGVPDVGGREEILSILLSEIRIDESSVSVRELAKRTPGFVGGDLRSVVREAISNSVERFSESLDIETAGNSVNNISLEELATANAGDNMQLDKSMTRTTTTTTTTTTTLPLSTLSVSMDDFSKAITRVLPAVKREGFVSLPSVSWDDVGALAPIIEELKIHIVQHINYYYLYRAMNLKKSCNVLLYGPPGCGKTLLAKAISSESSANFISVKGPELLNKYVGESERAVRSVFERARAAAPCVVFFDELDALVPSRGTKDGNAVTERVVNQMLTEMDGLSELKNVFVIGATNRKDLIDEALLRPGRFDRLLRVPLPTREERVDILKTLARKTPQSENVDLTSIAMDDRANGFSGADLAGLLREASTMALKRVIGSFESVYGGCDKEMHSEDLQKLIDGRDGKNGLKMQLEVDDFEIAFGNVTASIAK